MAMTGREMVEAAQKAVPKMPQADLKSQLDAGAHVVVLDVREREERTNNGYIAQATWVARGFIEGRVEETIPDKQTPIVTHWGGEGRAALAGQTLKQMGYTNVHYLAGGFNGWRDNGLPVEKPS